VNHGEEKCCSEECLCPVEGTLTTVSKKWAICIVSLLGVREEGYRFNELKRELEGISPKVLSERLKELQSEGLVNRVVKETSPPNVTYTLTEDGRELHTLLQPLVKWIKDRE